jgi:hypothetical protein
MRERQKPAWLDVAIHWLHCYSCHPSLFRSDIENLADLATVKRETSMFNTIYAYIPMGTELMGTEYSPRFPLKFTTSKREDGMRRRLRKFQIKE